MSTTIDLRTGRLDLLLAYNKTSTITLGPFPDDYLTGRTYAASIISTAPAVTLDVVVGETTIDITLDQADSLTLPETAKFSMVETTGGSEPFTSGWVQMTYDPGLPTSQSYTVKLVNSVTVPLVVNATGVASTLLARGTPWFDVRAFGAKGDGVTDDTEAIQSALDAVTAKGTVKVAGTYLIRSATDDDGGLRPKSNTTLDLRDAVIQAIPTDAGDTGANPASGIFLDNVSNVTILGGLVQGERDDHIGVTGEFAYGIEVAGGSDISIVGTTCIDWWGDGITLRPSTGGATPTNVSISGVTSRNNRRLGISIVAGIDVLVSNSAFLETNGTAPQAGVDVEPEAAYTVQGVQFSNCVFRDNVGSGFGAAGAGVLTDVTLSGCRSHDNNRGYSFEAGTRVTISSSIAYSNTSYGFYSTGVSNLAISSLISHSNSVGAYLDDNTDDSALSGLILYDNTSDGVRVQACDRLTITGASCYSNGGHGMSIGASSNDLVMAGCLSRDNANTGLLIDTVTNGLVTGCTFIGNNTSATAGAAGANVRIFTGTRVSMASCLSVPGSTATYNFHVGAGATSTTLATLVAHAAGTTGSYVVNSDDVVIGCLDVGTVLTQNAGIQLGATGGSIGVLGTAATTKQTVTGSRGGNAALASLIDALEAYGFITDSSS